MASFTLQFETDAPIAIKSVFYIPQRHREQMGMGVQEPSVSLYSRKVLITPKCAELLPSWMRFVVGVVDSEDIPLNISRESMQDSALLRRINAVLSKRLLKFLGDEAKKDAKAYESFFGEFSRFLKEGVCTDYANQKDIMRLLRYESSALGAGELTSLDDYISRLQPGQDESIYYLVTSSRAAAEASAYMEVFRKRNLEVLYCFQEVDEFVMQNAAKYESKALVSASAADLTIPEADDDTALSADAKEALAKWMMETALAGKVSEVTMSSRLVDSPAVINEKGQSASMRRFMRMVDQSGTAEQPKQALEINPSHPIVKKLNAARTEDEALAKLVAEQLFDNALIDSGMLEDARPMLKRLNELITKSLSGIAPSNQGEGPPGAA